MSNSRTKLDGLTLAYRAQGEILPYRIVKLGTADDSIVQATSGSDSLWGVSKVAQGGLYRHGTNPTTQPALVDDHVDVVLGGLPAVEYGGVVTRGDWLTSDPKGRAIKASAGNCIIGQAAVSGVEGSLGNVLISKGVL